VPQPPHPSATPGDTTPLPNHSHDRRAENLGKATGDEQMQREGQSDQSVSILKQAGEKVKDAFKKG